MAEEGIFPAVNLQERRDINSGLLNGPNATGGPAKRRRIAVACSLCRSRKSRVWPMDNGQWFESVLTTK